jgi:hypothetical protein
MATFKEPDYEQGGESRSAAPATLAFDGIVQTAGVLCILIGSFATEKLLVRIDPPVASLAPEVLVGPGSASLRWTF